MEYCGSIVVFWLCMKTRRFYEGRHIFAVFIGMNHPKLIGIEGMPNNTRNLGFGGGNFEQFFCSNLLRLFVDSPNQHCGLVSTAVACCGKDIAILKKPTICYDFALMAAQERSQSRVAMQYSNETILDCVHHKVLIDGYSAAIDAIFIGLGVKVGNLLSLRLLRLTGHRFHIEPKTHRTASRRQRQGRSTSDTCCHDLFQPTNRRKRDLFLDE